MFTNPFFMALHTRIARMTISWDAAINHGGDLPRADAWVRTAALYGIEPLISLSFAQGCYSKKGVVPHLAKCALPSVATYKSAFLAFRRRYPRVTDWSVWNEANHRSEPTSKNPRRAAEFYNVVRANCPGCTIVAADVLDQRGFLGWIHQFRRYAAGDPHVWGVHNYEDTNGHTSRRTRALLGAVPGEVWFTETGGIVHFPHRPFNPPRAARAVKYMFQLAQLSTRITRLYVYQWTGARITDRFDAGITSADGRPRPAYYVIRRYLDTHPQPTGFGPTGPSGPSGPSGASGQSGSTGSGGSGPPPSGTTGSPCPLPLPVCP
jgi:hypothetical protein